MAPPAEISETFPQLEAIADADLRRRVTAAWSSALAASEHDSVEAIPYLPKYRDYLGEASLGAHVRQTTAIAVALAEAIEAVYDGSVLDRDTVVAGALLHDVSKVLETPPGGEPGASTAIGDLLGHPHYAQHLLAAEGLSVELQHIALSHSPKTGVGIRTAEALVVWAADVLALNCLSWQHSGRLTPSFVSSPMGAGG